MVEAEPNGRAPNDCNSPVRINLVCALLSAFSGENLVPVFQKWRMPVTDESVAGVVKRYDLELVCAKVDEQFAQDYAQGRIHLDPMSLQVRAEKAPTGGASVSIFNVLGKGPGLLVRYTLDGSAVTATSSAFTGAAFPVTAATAVKAALFVPGKTEPALTTTAQIDPETIR